MGEARRRKMAGIYPDGGPVEDFRVPDGQLGITIEIHGEDPSTILFPASAVVDLLEQFEQAIGNLPGCPSYDEMVRGFADAFRKCKRSGADLDGVAISLLWTAFNHPRYGKTMRQGVSRQLRQQGRAHISWHCSEAGLAMGLGDRFIDLEDMLKHAPRNITLAVNRADGDDEIRQ